MSELLTAAGLGALAAIAGAAAGGLLLGLIFFAGLWWTLERIAVARRPGLLVLTSYVLRLGVAAGGFLLLAQGSWQRALACLAGFFAARIVVTRIVVSRRIPAPGGSHADLS